MKELNKGKVRKYVYTNLAFIPDLAKKNLKEGRYDLTNVRECLYHLNTIIK